MLENKIRTFKSFYNCVSAEIVDQIAETIHLIIYLDNLDKMDRCVLRKSHNNGRIIYLDNLELSLETKY